MGITIRDATPDDWDAIWPFMREIIAAGETYTYDRDLSESAARSIWLAPPPGRTFVAVDDDQQVVGAAIMGPNRGGPGAHVGTGSFMVDPAHAGHGAGRALGEKVVAQSKVDGYRAIQFNAVVETNTRAVGLWKSLGFEVLATVPEGFDHPEHGFVGFHIMFLKL